MPLYIIEFKDPELLADLINDLLEMAKEMALENRNNYPLVVLAQILFQGHWYNKG